MVYGERKKKKEDRTLLTCSETGSKISIVEITELSVREIKYLSKSILKIN